MVNAEHCRNGTIWNVMNKTFFLCVISTATITGCTDLPTTSAGTPPNSVPVTTTGTGTAYLPTPAAAAAPVVPPASENYGLYTDSDLQIYADTLDVRIQQALKNNNSSEAQTLGVKRQELIAEFNRRGLKRHQVVSTPGPRYSRKVDKVDHRRTRVSQPRTKVNASGSGLPGED
jgi:hypothetical protein